MDRRRINGPKRSIPLCLLPRRSSETKSQETTKKTPRDPEKTRAVFFKTGLLDQASGSAYSEMGRIKVAVAVYGPRPAKDSVGFSPRARVYSEFKFASIATRQRGDFQRSSQEREMSQWMTECLSPCILLDKYPKSTIDIYAVVYETDGMLSSFSLGVACASLALADAGIEMMDLVSASNLLIHPSRGLILDPTEQEEQDQEHQGSMLMASMPSVNSVTHLVQQGPVDHSVLGEAVEKLSDQNSKVYAAMSYCLTQAAQKKYKRQAKRKRQE